jgi:EAL domain-containing protein (putative c-di-GMP-specific phosphodiesterase class I)/GGDEF domain-containing protein
MVAALLGGIDFFEPLRPAEWQVQAYIAPQSASGDIIFIEASEDPNSPASAHIRQEFAALIDGLTAAGAHKILLNEIFDHPATPGVDEALRKAIDRSERTVLAQHYLTTPAGERVRFTIPRIGGSASPAIRMQRRSPFGYVWFVPYSAVINGTLLPTLPAAIAESTGPERAEFPIDYTISHASIPSFTTDSATAALSSERAQVFAGKTIVLGRGYTANSFVPIPGVQRVPPSIVTILAAETLKIGPPVILGWFLPLLAVSGCLLVAALALKQAPQRRVAYLAIAALPVAMLFAFAHLRVFADLVTPTAFLATFAALRLWHLRQQRASLTDGISGLPSFRKLEQDLATRKTAQLPAVVVAKIHRFDEVLSSLPSRHHAEYVRLVADRLRITDEALVIYSNGGRYLAWLHESEDEEQLRAHLLGLRAIFAHPLDVAGAAVDVGITYGADATTEHDASRKIAAAASAAEKTTEAHSPVLLARESSEADRLWNVSLQAKIDQALKSGEIYVVYQPQFDLRTGTMLGAEALVRWNDRERGHISPSYFIEQCEQVGRMDALTRKVFQEAIASVASSPLANTDFQLSMNVSAILLHDLRVVEMLKEELSSTAFPASRLTIEITETSRITDYDAARTVMDQLHLLGVRLSIDDFGVGAASLETLLLLPFDELKIDRMFVSRVHDNPKARGIVESLVRLGLDAGIVTIAEGVEDAETLATLKEVRCDSAQGYFLGRPEHLVSLIDHYPERVAL